MMAKKTFFSLVFSLVFLSSACLLLFGEENKAILAEGETAYSRSVTLYPADLALALIRKHHQKWAQRHHRRKRLKSSGLDLFQFRRVLWNSIPCHFQQGRSPWRRLHPIDFRPRRQRRLLSECRSTRLRDGEHHFTLRPRGYAFDQRSDHDCGFFGSSRLGVGLFEIQRRAIHSSRLF